MKKILLPLLLGVFLVQKSMAQISKNAFILATSFNLSQQDLGGEPFEIGGDPFPISINDMKTLDWHTSLSLGYSLSARDIIGASYQITRSKETSDQQRHITDPTTGESSLNSTVFIENINAAQSYGVFYRRLFNLSSRLYFVPQLDVLYESIDIEQKYVNYIPTISSDPIEDWQNSIDNISAQTLYRARFAKVELSSALLFQINSWLAVQAKFIKAGWRLNYRTSDPRQKQLTTRFEFDVSPQSWELGVLFIFQNKKNVK